MNYNALNIYFMARLNANSFLLFHHTSLLMTKLKNTVKLLHRPHEIYSQRLNSPMSFKNLNLRFPVCDMNNMYNYYRKTLTS